MSLKRSETVQDRTKIAVAWSRLHTSCFWPPSVVWHLLSRKLHEKKSNIRTDLMLRRGRKLQVCHWSFADLPYNTNGDTSISGIIGILPFPVVVRLQIIWEHCLWACYDRFSRVCSWKNIFVVFLSKCLGPFFASATGVHKNRSTTRGLNQDKKENWKDFPAVNWK